MNASGTLYEIYDIQYDIQYNIILGRAGVTCHRARRATVSSAWMSLAISGWVEWVGCGFEDLDIPLSGRVNFVRPGGSESGQMGGYLASSVWDKFADKEEGPGVDILSGGRVDGVRRNG